jgi:primase-polymerase (primpol)-like protein
VESSQLVDIDCDSNVIGNIISMGLMEEKLICPKCYSKDIETTDKSIKSKQCKTRSIIKKDVQDNRIKLTINTLTNQSVEVITEKEKLKHLLQESNNQDLCGEDLLENGSNLLLLSSINLSVTFNSRNKNLTDIQIYEIEH